MKIFSLCLIAASVGGCASAFIGPPPTTRPYTLTSDEIEGVKVGVKSALKDPGSAVFGGMDARAEKGKSGIFVCGYVNAKNSFGGFTGMQLFQGLLFGNKFVPTALSVAATSQQATGMICEQYGIRVADLSTVEQR